MNTDDYIKDLERENEWYRQRQLDFEDAIHCLKVFIDNEEDVDFMDAALKNEGRSWDEVCHLVGKPLHTKACMNEIKGAFAEVHSAIANGGKLDDIRHLLIKDDD
jgi:hypothetical protein